MSAMLQSKNKDKWKKLKPRGSKTKKWDAIRAELKKEFEAMGVTRCEMCSTDQWLSFSHRLKRRFITTDEELRTVALLCIPCHTSIEYRPDMYARVTDVINKRNERLNRPAVQD